MAFRFLFARRSQAAMHAAHGMCLRAQLVSLGPAVHQVTLQDGSKGLPSLGLRLSGLVLETRTGLHGLQSLTKGGGLFLPCQN